MKCCGGRGAENYRWNEGRARHGRRIYILLPDHPRANTKGYVAEHILVMETVFGGPLPDGYLVHHKNEKPDDNHPDNLCLCKDDQEHMTLHQRIRALRACGHEDWRVCRYCHKYDDPSLMYVHGHLAHHRLCENLAKKKWISENQERNNRNQRNRYARKKAERSEKCS